MIKTTSKNIRFPGHFRINEDIKARFVATIEYELYDPSSLEIELLFLGDEEEKRIASNYLQNLEFNCVWLHSDDSFTPSVEILGIHGVETSTLGAHINALAIQSGLSEEILAQQVKYIVKVELIPSGILQKVGIRELSYTGSISFRSIVDGKVPITSELGKLEAEERYDHYESYELGNQIIHTVQRAAITGVLEIPKGKDLLSTNETMRLEIEEICLMLSLCYRQPVDYYEIQYIPDPEAHRDHALPVLIVRRKHETPVKKTGTDELINFRNLIDGGLDRLVKSYRKFQRKDDLRRSIQFLASSFRVVTLESSFFLAYSALECVVSAVSEESHYLIRSGLWKRVEKLMREFIDKISISEGFTDVADQVKDKLPELRRATSVNRISEMCCKLGVEISDIWPKEGFTSGLSGAAKMRNDLFHSALCESAEDLSNNLIRIRTLTERIILKALCWPDNEIWRWYDQNLKWINKGSG